MSSLTLSGSPPPPPPPPPPVNTVCRQTDAPLIQINNNPQVLAPGPQYDQLARTMGYTSFDLIIRGDPTIIYINNLPGRDIALIVVTEVAPVVFAGAPAGTEANYNSTGDRLILILRGGGLTAEYTLAVNRSASPVTLIGIVLVISGCQKFSTCPALLTTTVSRTTDNVLKPTRTNDDLARQMGFSTFNIAIQPAPNFAYIGNITSANGNVLTVFTAQNTDYGLSFTVPASALPFATVHRQEAEITLVLTSLPGSEPNYFATYKLRLNNNQLIGGTLEVLGCRANIGGFPPLPPIPPLNSPGTEYPQINISGFLTADGQNVCQLNVTVETASGLCSDCKQLTSKRYEFVRYCPDFASVLCGVGCTVVSKADSLNVDSDQLIVYATLRYVFSALLCDSPFNKFDVNLLRQRFTKDFLITLRESQFSEVFHLFVEPPYRGLGKYFKK